MNNSDYAIRFDNLSLADTLHVHTRVQFTDPQLRALGDIPGVTRYSAGNNPRRSYLTSVSATMRAPYCNSVSKGRLFTFDELAPQILLVFADALGVEVEDMDVTVAPNGGSSRIVSGSWIVVAARKLRPKISPRNPLAPFAATADDIKPGAELMTIDMMTTAYRSVTITTVPPTGLGYLGLAYAGIAPISKELNTWDKAKLSIVNSQENRRKLVDWLVERGMNRLAGEIIMMYVADFVSVDSTNLPKGFEFVMKLT